MKLYAFITALLVWMSLLPGMMATASAEDGALHYNQVHFQADSSEQVTNDLMRAVLWVQLEDSNPSSLARQINDSMDWALSQARDYKDIKSRTTAYNTTPIYYKNEFKSWRGSQELVLEGGDFEGMAKLVGQLQARLQVRSMGFTVSPETRRMVQDELLDKALEAFRARAERVRKSMGSSGYRLVSLNINTGGQSPMPMPMMRMAAMAEDSSVAVAGGESTLGVSVDAVIQLQ